VQLLQSHGRRGLRPVLLALQFEHDLRFSFHTVESTQVPEPHQNVLVAGEGTEPDLFEGLFETQQRKCEIVRDRGFRSVTERREESVPTGHH